MDLSFAQRKKISHGFTVETGDAYFTSVVFSSKKKPKIFYLGTWKRCRHKFSFPNSVVVASAEAKKEPFLRCFFAIGFFLAKEHHNISCSGRDEGVFFFGGGECNAEIQAAIGNKIRQLNALLR